MACNLETLSPIAVHGGKLPSPQLFNNIPILHWTRVEVVEAWSRAVEPYQVSVDTAETESAQRFAVGTGFMESQTAMLKCLYSYAFFFVSANNAYGNFYKELNRANNLPGLNLKHSRPPQKTPFVTKIANIRDISVAHIPSETFAELDTRYLGFLLFTAGLIWLR